MSGKKDKTKEEIEMVELKQKEGQMSSLSDPLIISDSEEKIDEEFRSSLKKYNQISRRIRLAAIEKEKRELEGFDKSPVNKYYPGTKIDRLKILEEEKELLQKMEKLAQSKQQK
ncbi:uncharacterized protein LOC135841457 [Planococcus citri]|uniref:uncharacterized protein LOC135841457 n=1 Tax=Planococcus citri TaxID=170843 RepID=UPI0031F87E03